eukprot:gnl/Chilomastix_cuspidata/1307.p1 GENE.gnl/Chilomastix_cuspidata/1307~~gnl/Chilomastix_cuspidata/1307.p1  ORF type:complete len:2521 (+),score=430.49 gnl/Chilomastix_cuspidata/1307:148-7563(+)
MNRRAGRPSSPVKGAPQLLFPFALFFLYISSSLPQTLEELGFLPIILPDSNLTELVGETFDEVYHLQQQSFLQTKADSFHVDHPAIIPWGLDQTDGYKGNDWRARNNILTNLESQSSNTLFYPYLFSAEDLNTSYAEQPDSAVVFSEGAFLRVDGPDELPESYESYFHWWDALSGVDVTRGSALFAVSVAILQAIVPYDTETFSIVDESDYSLDLTWDSDAFCAAFTLQASALFPQCYTSVAELDAHIEDTGADSANVWITYVTPDEIAEGALFDTETGDPRFGILFFPDVIEGFEETVANLIGTTGAIELSEYVNQGGTLYTSAKGAVVVDHLGELTISNRLLSPPAGHSTFFDKSTLLVSPDTSTVSLSGCSRISFSAIPPEYDGTNDDEINEDHVQRTLCFALLRNSDLTKAYTSIVSTYLPYPDAVEASSLIEIESFSYSSNLKYRNAVTSVETTVGSADSLPALLYRTYGAGRLVFALHSPEQSSYGKYHLHNAFLLAAQQPLMVSVSIDGGDISVFDTVASVSGSQLVVPALELISLNVELNLVNLGSDQIDSDGGDLRCTDSNFEAMIFQVPGIDLSLVGDADSICSFVSFPTDASVDALPVAQLNTTADAILCCADSTLDPLEPFPITLQADVVDPLVTQEAVNIPVLYYSVQYASRSRGRTFSSFVEVRSAEAARMEATFNPDPSSFYPILGRGAYTDVVLHAENKAATEAYNVQSSITFPLISPVVDISDRLTLSKAAIFDNDYFYADENSLDEGYTVDWLGSEPADSGFTEHKDALCYQDFVSRGNFLAADWDTPARLSKSDISDYGLPLIDDVISQIPLASFTAYVTDRDILEQEYFEDADDAFEHAAQRLIPFLDPSDSSAATTLWGADTSLIPEEDYSANFDSGRSRLMFVHNDIYFYSHEMYPMPANVELNNRTVIITADKKKTSPVDGWTSKNGRRSTTYAGLEGSYNRVDGLVPSQWENEILLNPDVTIIPYLYPSEGGSDPFESDTRFSSELPEGFSAARTYAVFPVSDSQRVMDAGDIWEFDASTGRHDEYTELVFVKPLTLELTIPTEVGTRGGLLEIVTVTDISSRISAFDVEPYTGMAPVSVSADQISVIDTSVESNGSSSTISVAYTRGLLPNESTGKDLELKIFILVGSDDTTVEQISSIQVREMFYELGSVDGGIVFADEGENIDVPSDFECKGAFLVPAITLEFDRVVSSTSDLSEEEQELSVVSPYELVEPLVRVGVYSQELKHRPVHGNLEVHTDERPLVTFSGGFSIYSAVGISSVPFREYVNTGTSLNTPATPKTSRVSWKDIWGRQFHQPLRTIVPDVPPIPPPVRSFSLSSSFEILSLDGTRLSYWPSDESVDLHVTLKVRNGYPKYFELTNCQDTRLYHTCTDRGCSDYKTHIQIDSGTNEPLIDPAVFPLSEEYNTTRLAGNLYASPSTHSSRYGICYSEAPAYTSGSELDAATMELLANASANQMKLCASDDDPSSCESIPSGVSGISQRAGSDDGAALDSPETLWNYAQLVEEYYPVGYIDDTTMWDITHWDYSDTAFAKAYPYHLDNLLPSIGNALTNPHNLLYYGIFKGLGFSVSYDKGRSNPGVMAGGVSGWYSENLQNKDHTLLAGNSESNAIAPSSLELVTFDDFVEISSLEGDDIGTTVASALSNMNICLFNRWFLRSNTSEDRMVYPFNVNVNNVIPIDPTLDKADDRLLSYECGDTYYLPSNISQADNYLETDASCDYLYFSMNVRGEAREDVHVLTRVAPLENRNPYTGSAKLFDGGRLTYWVPANGPNSYQTITSPAVVVDAKANVIEHSVTVLSPSVSTFDATAYLLLALEDPVQPILFQQDYTVSYAGFGDIMISTYVGGWNGCSAMLSEIGESTVVRVEVYNTAGFDIYLLASAIDWEEKDSAAINADDLLKGHTSAIKAPTAFNFLEPVIPDELDGVVEFAPFQFVAGVASQFFDFPNTHVTTIKDGWKGTYFYEMTVIGVADGARGRVHEIPFVFNAEHFSNLPGSSNDPRGVGYAGAYELAPPPARWAYVYSGTQTYPGLAFHLTTEPAHDIETTFVFPAPFEYVGALAVTSDEQERMSICATSENPYQAMDALWDELSAASESAFSLSGLERALAADTEADASAQTVTLSAASAVPGLPYETVDALSPQQADLKVLVKLSAERVPSGWNTIQASSRTAFVDWREADKAAEGASSGLKIQAKGAWMQVTSSNTYHNPADASEEYAVIPYNTTVVAQTKVYTKNIGDYIAYNVNTTVSVCASAEFYPELAAGRLDKGLLYEVGDWNGTHYNVTLRIDEDISPGASKLTTLWFELPTFRFVAGASSLGEPAAAASGRGIAGLLGAAHADVDAADAFVFQLVGGSAAQLDLTENKGERTVEQPQPYGSYVSYEVYDPPEPEYEYTFFERFGYIFVLAAIVAALAAFIAAVLCARRAHRRAHPRKRRAAVKKVWVTSAHTPEP